MRLDVSDTGRGVPFHVQAHIVRPLRRPRSRGGPGLGLALVKALVELHGGWVALESEPAPARPSPATCRKPNSRAPCSRNWGSSSRRT
ncbi:sensor histidine kinase [Caulobacter segnis]